MSPWSRWSELLSNPTFLRRWVLFETALVTVLLLVLWGVADKDTVVVYMRF